MLNSYTSNLPPLFYDGVQLPYTDSFKYMGMVCDRQINLNTAADAALRPFTAGTFRIRQFIREHELTKRLHICMWLLETYAISAGMYASQVWATPFLRQGKEMDNPIQKWLVTVLKWVLMAKDTTPSWCVMRECGLEPLQFNWFRVAVRLYNAFTQSNSSTARKIFQADMQLSSWCNDCWSSHILSAMNGLTQSYLFKERLLTHFRNVSPLILVVLLWTSGRGTWIIGHLILIYIHESATANAPLTINGVPSLPGGPWSHICHTPFLDTCFLIFLATLFAAWLASDFVPTLYELKL